MSELSAGVALARARRARQAKSCLRLEEPTSEGGQHIW